MFHTAKSLRTFEQISWTTEVLTSYTFSFIPRCLPLKHLSQHESHAYLLPFFRLLICSGIGLLIFIQPPLAQQTASNGSPPHNAAPALMTETPETVLLILLLQLAPLLFKHDDVGRSWNISRSLFVSL